MKISLELTQAELACLLFWYACLELNAVSKPIDMELFTRLKDLYDNMELTNIYTSMFSPLPKYQPGEVIPEGEENFWPPIFFG